MKSIHPVAMATQTITAAAESARMNGEARATSATCQAIARLTQTTLTIRARTPRLSDHELAALSAALMAAGLHLVQAIDKAARGEHWLTVSGSAPLTLAEVNRELGVA